MDKRRTFHDAEAVSRPGIQLFSRRGSDPRKRNAALREPPRTGMRPAFSSTAGWQCREGNRFSVGWTIAISAEFSQGLGHQSLTLVGPFEGLGHGTVEILDEGQHFGPQMRNGAEAPALE